MTRTAIVAPARRPLRLSLPLAAQVLLVLFVVTTCAAGYLLPRYGIELGAPSPPFYGFFHPLVTAWTGVALLALAGLVRLVPRILALGPRGFALLGIPLALAVRVAVNVARLGPHELVRPLTGRMGENDALSSLHLFTDHPVAYLGSFPDRVHELGLPVQVMGHPPGGTVLLGALSGVGLGGPWSATAAVLLVGAAAAPLVYLLGRELGEERTARIAMLAWLFAPSVVLESATSMDAVYATAAVGTALLIVRAGRAAPALAVVACSFLSYALLGAVTWALLVLALRGRRRHALELALLAAVAGAAGYGLLWATTGYDPMAALRATRFAYEHGVSQHRPGWFWAAGDLAAFFVALGPLVALGFARSLGERQQLAVATIAVLLVAALGGFTKAEVERIWLFMVPFVAISAAPSLRRPSPQLLVTVLAAQALAVEVLFGTTW